MFFYLAIRDSRQIVADAIGHIAAQLADFVSGTPIDHYTRLRRTVTGNDADRPGRARVTR